jgi:hypothetical protein
MFLVQTHEVPVNCSSLLKAGGKAEAGRDWKAEKDFLRLYWSTSGIFADFFPHPSHDRLTQLERDDTEWNCRSMRVAFELTLTG